MVDPDALRAVAVDVASEAGELVKRMRGGQHRFAGEVGTKSTATDVVTEADRAAEELIRARLAERRPGDGVLGEEAGADAVDSEVRWVVDPIDGTVNYLYGLPQYSVSVAAEVGGLAVAAAVVEPAAGRVWSAARGRGATLDGEPLRAGATTELPLALVATGFSYSAERRARQADLVAGVLRGVRDIRRGGSAAIELCSVAAGWVDAFYEHGLGHWDWAGGGLIAEEAGAVVRRPRADGTDPDGLGADLTLAVAPGVAAALTGLLRDSGAAEV
ncbi:myo-inositol-1(or 4)-monophosphatase [Crossiella equi]|uniref:Inositol-1-monophosphatase n=1 Tax=Crossiella equi TaxID=130796 RepID=A0ABS5AB42_9PSEU|nr:inositol monophosphatase family protein [Crossiella equi]MBP2473541.1 myo-inositol-1(or 4)-monophosphatase [Crossiella equi]